MTTHPPLILVAAVAVLVELAGAGDPVSTRILAFRRHSDRRATRLLLQRLRDAGLVDIVLGPAGGVRLAWPPRAITLAAVVDALAEPLGEAGGLGRKWWLARRMRSARLCSRLWPVPTRRGWRYSRRSPFGIFTTRWSGGFGRERS